ncbi:MAG: alpha/beta hydrolase [Actinomycetota bacterium]
MEPWGGEFAGRLDEHQIESRALEGNPLGDPHVRPLWVLVPPGYDDEPQRRYPCVFVIQGYTGQIDMWRNRSPWRRNFPELADRGMKSGEIPPCIVVLIDAWTSYGGSQYLDSPGTGNYLTYVCDEIVPWVDERYRTHGDREHRGIAGKSSGGYGAMVLPMLRPDVWGGFATHAGDTLYEVSYLPHFGEVARVLRDKYDGSYDRFWEDFNSRPALSKEDDGLLTEIYGVAAAYSADPDGTPRLPFDIETGRLLPEVWERWLALDPVRMVSGHAEELRSMRAIYIDAGKRDEYFLDLGAEAFRRELEAAGVTGYFFELFDATHMMIEYRYPKSLAYLAERLS